MNYVLRLCRVGNRRNAVRQLMKVEVNDLVAEMAVTVFYRTSCAKQTCTFSQEEMSTETNFT